MTTPTDPVEYRQWLGIRPFSAPWAVSLRALYGKPLTASETELFRQLTSGVDPRPGDGWSEFLANVGRGGGKDDAIKSVVNFECAFGGHHIAAAPGQRLMAEVLCPLRNQARGLLAMAQGEASLPAMRKFVTNSTRDALEFTNGLVAQIQTCDDVAVVGDTVVLAVRNEWALFPGPESSTPDTVIDSNLRPALRQIAGAPLHRLIGITSSYVTEGLAYETFRDNFGRNDADVLVVKGGTELFNPAIDPAWLAKERRRLGPRAAAMHFDCEWQPAIIESWFGADTIDRCIDHGHEYREPVAGQGYVVTIDQAFSGDHFALAVAHREQNGKTMRAVLDCVQWWKPPIVLLKVIHDTAKLAREYGSTAMLADQYSFRPLRELYLQQGIQLRQLPWTGANKAPTFRAVLNEMQAGRVSIPDDPELIKEFHAIQGRALRSGGEQIEARSGHDDLVHAAVMALAEVMRRTPDYGEYQRPHAIMAVSPPDPTRDDSVTAHGASRYRGRDYSHSTAAERERQFIDDN